MPLVPRQDTDHPSPPICCHCGQPLRPGDPHWAGDADHRPWHYGCAEKAGLTMAWTRVRHRRAGASG